MLHVARCTLPEKNGFTLPELIITFAIAGVLLGLTTINLFGSKNKASLATTVITLIADANQQRLKAMVGDTEAGTTNESYGIYFAQNNYVLFRGSTYSPSDSNNFTINLGDNIQFINNLFPQSQVVFSKGSGEILNFIPGSNTITLQNTITGEVKTLTINKLGTIYQLN